MSRSRISARRRGTRVAASCALLAIVAVRCALPALAPAEQASQPASATAGGLDVGGYHACAVLPSASLRCWGNGADGALGYANTATIGDDETPAAAGPVDLGGRAAATSAGSFHTCALLEDGTVRCWGYGGEGRLGYANKSSVGDDETPASVGPVALGGAAAQISAGLAHTCAVLEDGTVRCWGFAADGRLGYGFTNRNDIGDDETPASAGPVKLGGPATAISAGYGQTCAILRDQTVRCWGSGSDGELGYASVANVGDLGTPNLAGPVDLGVGSKAVAITAGTLFTCALLDNGRVYCWGYGANGRLGHGDQMNIGDDETPVSAGQVPLGGPAKAISAGDAHACAVLTDGSVRCWGYGGGGRLGYANTDSIGDDLDETPATAGPVDLGPGRTAVAISAGAASTCARLNDGSVRCWGQGAQGRLGLCNTTMIGDNELPGSVGPINLAPGDGGAGCAATPSAPGAPPAPPDRPIAPNAPGPPAGGAPPAAAVDETAAALAAEKTRAAALRDCLRRVSRRARASRLPARPSAIAMRQINRRAKRDRGRCLKRYERTPGRVGSLRAEATGPQMITLAFTAAGTDHAKPPAARTYLVKQSRHPIRDSGDFHAAHSLCAGTCRFDVTKIGTDITVIVDHLRPRSTYYYAIAARDNVTARLGPRSETLMARTR